MSSFVHLHTHSSSSIRDGIMPAAPLKKAKGASIPEFAAADGQEAVALTDLGLMVSSIEFYDGARNKGVKPIMGVDAYIEPDVTQGIGAKPTRVVLLAQNREGYQKIMDWVTRAWLNNQSQGLGLIKQSWFRDEGTDNVIALSGDMVMGEIAQAVIMDDVAAARSMSTAAMGFYRQVFDDRFYLEIQRYNQPNEALQVQRLVALARHTNTPLVATHPVQFGKRDDFQLHEIRYCISAGEVLTSPGRLPAFTSEQYFKTQAEMGELFSDLPEALANTLVIARRCTTELSLGKNFLPDFDTKGQSSNDFLRKMTTDGLEARLLANYPDAAEREAKRPEYQARLDHELGVIAKMDFPGYFLIVADFIQWTKDKGMMVGPGRGSGAGSLVAYALQITDIDPMPYGLLFERFLNPERVSMPDFDIDFEQENRQLTMEYVREKYGHDRVAQIATLGRLKGKSALNEVSRAMGISPMTQGKLSSLLPKKGDYTIIDQLNGSEKINDEGEIEIIRPNKELRQRYENEGEIRKIVDMAMRLEGAGRSMGVHASGLVIAPNHVQEFSPLYYDPSSSSALARVQFDGPSIERAGLVKFDFLGLKTLDIIKATVKAINERPEFKDKPFSDNDIPLKDKKTLENFALGNAIDVFQFESDGMRGMLVGSKPDRFEDLIALVALYRPGPMSLIPTFAKRKAGLEPTEYPDPRMEKVLGETYGIMVYQEQVMQMAQIVAGYSLGGADLLRRAMGKKKPEEMAKQRDMFIKGAMENGADYNMTEEQADKLFNTMEKFAAYGFNKSHAAAYALVSFRTMYLKTHYPIEFAVANMNFYSLKKKHDKLEATILDARAQGLKILPPDINHPVTTFTATGKGIRYGLAGLKGVNEDAIEAIAKAHKEAPFTDFFDFFRRVPKGSINKRVVDALVKVGAFDSVNADRATLLATVSDAIKYATKWNSKKAKEEKVITSEDLPEATGTRRRRKAAPVIKEVEVPEFVQVQPWSENERLNYEHAMAGFYISGHPFDIYARLFNGLRAAMPLREISLIDPDRENGQLRLISGVITDVFERETQDGDKWGRVTLNDGEHSYGLMVFKEAYTENQAWLKPGAFVGAAIKIEHDRRNEGATQARVDHLITADALQESLMKRMLLALQPSDMDKLAPLLERHAQPDTQKPAVGLTVHLPDDQSETGEHYLQAALPGVRLKPSVALIQDLRETFGEKQVFPTYQDRINLVSQRKHPQRKYNNNGGGRRSGPR